MSEIEFGEYRNFWHLQTYLNNPFNVWKWTADSMTIDLQASKP